MVTGVTELNMRPSQVPSDRRLEGVDGNRKGGSIHASNVTVCSDEKASCWIIKTSESQAVNSAWGG